MISFILSVRFITPSTLISSITRFILASNGLCEECFDVLESMNSVIMKTPGRESGRILRVIVKRKNIPVRENIRLITTAIGGLISFCTQYAKKDSLPQYKI